jgi:cyclopropane fatty-acyl-phospholipid synthase-like methyltransferase
VGTADPIELLFAGMEKLGPGSDEETRQVLHRLPRGRFDVVIDAGCGAGRQTMVLIEELRTLVHAVDSHEPFLQILRRRAAQANAAHLLQVHCMDMQDIASRFPTIDLLWSEGAAYNIGFANGLGSWSRSIRPGGFAVLSELAWLTEDVPQTAGDFFTAAYPGMRFTNDNVKIAEEAGYEVLATQTVSREAWTDGYYDVLRPRARALAEHADEAVRQFAGETLREIEVFETAQGSYGYVFYVMRRR